MAATLLLAAHSQAKKAPDYHRIDVHTHIDPSLYPAVLQVLEKVGIERMVNLSGGPAGPVLKETLKLAAPHAPRILTCTNVDWNHMRHPDFGQRMAKDLETAAQLGAACLKIPKALGLGVMVPKEGLLRVDDARLKPLWTAAASLKLPVFIHVGDPKAFWLPPTPDNERYDELSIHPGWSFADPRFPRREVLLGQFEKLLADNPRTTFIGVHFGNDPEDIDATDRRLKRFPNLYIDTAARVGEIGRNDPEKLRRFFIRHQDRVLFGTDFGVGGGSIMLGSSDGKEPTPADVTRFFSLHWRFFEGAERNIPHPTPIQGRWKVSAIRLPEGVLKKLYRDNALRLLRWPG